MIATQREAYVQELAALADLRAQFKGEPLVRLLVEAATLHTEANLRVVELAEASRPDFSSQTWSRQDKERADEPGRAPTRKGGSMNRLLQPQRFSS